MLHSVFIALTLALHPTVHVTYAEDETKVEVSFAVENVPSNLKPGAKVDLKRIDARSVTGSGQVAVTTTVIAQSLVVDSVDVTDKPKSPEEAVKVGLRVTKKQAAMIEKLKALRITVRESDSAGNFKTSKKPVPLMLELSK